MLETDCIIPKHVPIPHPEHHTLYGDARAVKALMDEGLGKWAIIKKLRLSEDAYMDAMYEIKKQRAVEEMNGRNERMPDTKEELREKVKLLLAGGMKQAEIARELGYSKGRISQIVKEINSGKKDNGMQINKEFDDAVNQMIEESKQQEIVQTNKPVTMTEEHTVEAVPDAVMQAVADKIETLSAVLSDNLLTIKEMQQNNEQIRSELAVLYGWRAEHEGAEN